MEYDIYRNIAERTKGEVYIGVVGPMRAGKSTFIKKFMESAILPNIEDEFDRSRTKDGLPQSAGGRTVMTAEPKFVPEEAVRITVGDSISVKVKMIDCVGYPIPGILGDTENGEVRQVFTPWSEEALPFAEAAQRGTEKVIREHSTVGILLTSDGSFGELPRENYIDAENRAAEELKKIGKPYTIVLNSSRPESKEAEEMALRLEKEHGVPVALVNCLDLNLEDIEGILSQTVGEFPLKEIKIGIPSWVTAAGEEHWLKKSLIGSISDVCADRIKASGISGFGEMISDAVNSEIGKNGDGASAVETGEVNAADGSASIMVTLSDELYFNTVTELTGEEIKDNKTMLKSLCEMAEIKKRYERYKKAINDVNEKGYGIVMPEQTDLTLEEPQIVKQAGGYGVRLKASAPSVHMIKTNIETELNPVVGSEEQSAELVKYLLDDFKEKPETIWDTDLFGKSIYDLINEGLNGKLEHMPEDAGGRLGDALSRVINDGASGLICIIL